ncbi:MAG: [protein-PII] uridylyltransferase [Actinomycetota bacterium]|nr:[protein-PII] uridylyltransferase [Actinomycetota bacterium]
MRLQDGARAARERAVDVDGALARLTEEALGPTPPLAAVAVGGYGRGELSPHSDIDLLFLVGPRSDVSKATLRGLLYPLWDAGFQVGHSVRTPKETIERGAIDLDAATSLLSARLIAGDEHLFDEFLDRLDRWIRKDARGLVRRIVDSTRERHRRVDRAGWVLAPDLKEDIGGLRDIHRLEWLSAVTTREPLPADLVVARETFLAVREALHAEVKSHKDTIHIDLQPAVARRMGLEGDSAADQLMAEVHTAARTVEHSGSAMEARLAQSVLGGPRRSGSTKLLGGGVQIVDGLLTTVPTQGLDESDRAVALLEAKAASGRELDPRAISWLRETFAETEPGPWSDAMRESFLGLLGGPHVADALELADHVGAWKALMPEWLRVRGLAQHDPYHRFTVDGHLFGAVALIAQVLAADNTAAIAASEAGDLATLRIATLFHDIGKGSGEDHSIAGERLVRAISSRMGLAHDQIEDIATLVRHHLLLSDTATRRDLDDGAVISDVAEKVATGQRLRLLYVLSAADGRATGPEAWSEWKAVLVRDLYRKALIALETGELPARSDARARAEEVEAYEPSLAGRALDLLTTLPPSYLGSTSVPDTVDELRLLLQPPKPGEVRYRIEEGGDGLESSITICVVDRPGALARTAGVFSLHRISVLRAQAFSTTTGFALERFIVRAPEGGSWDKFIVDLKAAYSGRLAIEARLEKKAADYRPKSSIAVDVRILQEESEHSTVIEVRASDAMGLLFAITAALTDLDLDIHVAKIDTLGVRVVDVFYVRTSWGTKLEADQAAEVERAIRHRLERLFGTN